MPVTAVPDQYLTDKLVSMQRRLDDLARALGRPNDQIRDINDNVVQMLPGTDYPVWGNKDQDVSFIMANGAVAVGDATGRQARPISAQTFYGPVLGDTTGVHHGDVGVAGTEFHNHYGDLHGNSYGFHYGPVGDGATQNQINALNVFSTGHFGTQHGDVGTPTEFWQLYGTVHAPSERGLKTDEAPFNGGPIVDAVPAPSWRWDPLVRHDDGELHAGPMVDDIELVAPWLVRKPTDPEGARMLSDRDLIGVLWSALRDARERISVLETK